MTTAARVLLSFALLGGSSFPCFFSFLEEGTGCSFKSRMYTLNLLLLPVYLYLLPRKQWQGCDDAMMMHHEIDREMMAYD